MTVYCLTHQLEPVWKRSIQKLWGGFILSPSWISPLLVQDDLCQLLSTIADRGKASANVQIVIHEIQDEQSRTHLQRPRFAIGQSAEGDWLLIAY